MTEQQKPINVKFPEDLKSGTYANMMAVAHTREEFILDFMLLAPPGGTVTSRIICSPGHMKRIVTALQENIKKYEEKFGTVTPADEPRGRVGFTKH